MQGKETIEIIDYSDDLKEHIKRLNYEWLTKYFKVEERDAIQLSDPKKHIIDKGGFIFYAKSEGEIIGTVSLLKVSDEVFELGKMGVKESFRGRGIGKILMDHALAFAQKKGIKELILFSAKKLKPAMRLYEKYGFKEVEFEPGHYERGDVKMGLKLA